jgi:hypothetical protein
MILTLRDGDSCHGTLPPEEEEPRVLSYAAAEMILTGEATRQRSGTEERGYKAASAGGGRLLRM